MIILARNSGGRSHRHPAAADKPQKSPLSHTRERSRLGESKKSLIIANAAARGDGGVSLMKLVLCRIADGDFSITLSTAPGLISSIGFGDGISQSSNNTLPFGASSHTSSSSPSLSFAPPSPSLSLVSLARATIDCVALAFTSVLSLSLASPRRSPNLAVGVFIPGVFTPIADVRPDLPTLPSLAFDRPRFIPLEAFSPTLLRFSELEIAVERFEFIVTPFRPISLVIGPDAVSVVARARPIKFTTHLAHPRSLYRHFEHPIARRARRCRRPRASPARRPRSFVADVDCSPTRGKKHPQKRIRDVLP